MVEMKENKVEKGKWEGVMEEKERRCTDNIEQHQIGKVKRFPATYPRTPKKKGIPATKLDNSRKSPPPTESQIAEHVKIKKGMEEKGKVEEKKIKEEKKKRKIEGEETFKEEKGRGKIEKGKIQQIEEEKWKITWEKEIMQEEEEEQYLDGGWGWMVVLGGAMMSLLQSLLVTSQSLTFISLLEKFPHLQTAVVSGTMALYNGCKFISGKLCFLHY